jgi:anti-sigma factor RsiW
VKAEVADSKCPDIDLIHRYASGEAVTEYEMKLAESHIRECDSCRREYNSIISTIKLLTEYWDEKTEHCIDTETLAEYSEGILDEETNSRIKEHLKDCIVCSQELEMLRAIDFPTQQELASFEMPKDVDERIFSALMKRNMEFARKPSFSFAGIKDILDSLQKTARVLSQIWAIPAYSGARDASDLKISPDNLREDSLTVYHLGDRVRIVINSDREGYLTLLDEGTEGIICSLCPSRYAPDTRIHKGYNLLPQEGSDFKHFIISGKPGQEKLLAIVTNDPLGFDWMPAEPNRRTHILTQEDIDLLKSKLKNLEMDNWSVIYTYFDVTE